MSLYKINRSRSLSFVGKFKFDYTVEFNGSAVRWTQFGSSRGAYIDFRRGLEFTGLCVVSNNSADDNGYIEHPFGPGGDFGIPAPDVGGNYEVRLNYFLKGGLTSERRYFTLSIQPPPNSNDELLNDPGDELAGGFSQLRRIVRGSIEGFIFDNEPLDEYVEVSEYYPSEVQTRPGNCPGSLDEFWVDKKLDQNTVRQWPKYTSLRWFETPNPRGKRTLGIYVKHISGNKETTHFASYDASPSLFTEYNQYKAFNAWSGDTTGNNGYCTISSNLEYTNQQIIPARTDRVTVDLDKFSILPAGRGYNRQATTIVPNSAPVRNVSFESVVKDWKQNHSDELTAYLVGFNSDGVNKVSDETGEYPAPTYQTVTTKSGVISASQTYLRYESPTITAREEGQSDFKSFSKFDNTQKWIFGMLDGSKAKALNKELFDDLESPPKNYDFPDKYVTRQSLSGGFYCVNINQINQDLTIDESELPSGYMSIPIPLRGWKFNALSLYQEPELVVPGSGNIRDYTIEDNVPKYYGNFNLSGYRYLDLQVKSKDQNTQTSSFQIDEISRGPKTLGGDFNINEKKWEISTSSNIFEDIRIDLCNPDNKIEKVDNQDSPYPRLNTYTTSIPKFRETFAYLSKENSPKDTFITTKKTKTSSDDLWINVEEAKTIASSGIVYLLNEADSVIDYFEVDSSKLPKSGTATTNLIFGKPRVRNGKVKLAKYWNGSEADGNPEYRKTLWITIPRNLLTSGRSINELLDADKDGKYPKEFQIYDFDPGYEDVVFNITKLSKNYLDNSNNIFVNKVSIYENGDIVPYNAVILTAIDTKVSRKYKIVQYQNDVQGDNSYFVIENNSTSDKNLIFFPDKTEVSLGFYNPESDDTFRTGYVKFEKINKVGNIYEARIEYFKQKLSDEPIFEGIPVYESGFKYNYFTNSSPIVSLDEPRLVEYKFPVDTAVRLNLDSSPSSPSSSEINAIDDYPEDEASNDLYYGVSRIAKIAVDSNNLELGTIKLTRDNSLGNFVITGNKNTFNLKTKFIVAENANIGTPTETEYFTRRFWQHSTDGRDEEEGDIEWQHTTSATLDNWTLFPRTISEFCDEINAKDVYVAPRWLDPSNSASEIIRHPGWKAKKVDKGLTGGVEPIWKEALLDPDYLNSDSGYSSWIYGGGLLALPSGKNSGSGTSYFTAIDVSLNEIKNILAQTIFHRINGDFPPGKPDLFGNTSLLNEDGTKQESTLHLRGGLIVRGPGHGLILPPAESTPDALRQATLFERTPTNPINAGSDETDAYGFYETETPYGKTNVSHVIQVSESAEFPNPDELTSSSRNISQGKRERASFKQGEGASAVSLSTVESGFEHSFVIAYEIPTENAKNEGRTGIISTGSFYDSNYEKYSLGFGQLPSDSGTGVSMKGFLPFLVSTELTDNLSTNTHCFVLTEKNSDVTTNKSTNYSSLIASNTRVLSRNAWAPFIAGQSAENQNFSVESILFSKTKLNSYLISDFNPEIYMVGFADPGSIIFHSTHIDIAGVQAPFKSKTLLVDGAIPTDQKSFNLFDELTSSSNAFESHPTLIQLISRELIVCYLKDENKKKILFKTISNDKVLESTPNVLLDLEKIAGVSLDKKYEIYGLNSTYGELGETIHFIFWSNGNIYYFSNDFSSSDRADVKIDKIHLIKGEVGDDLSTALQNKGILVSYFNSTDTFNLTSTYGKKVPKHRSGITIAKKQDYYYKMIVTFDTGKCNLQSVLFEPFKQIEYVREFKIECVSKGTNKRPRAKITANPTSGNSALNVQFSSDGSTDPENAQLTYKWNFDDGTTSTLANPSHLFYNSTTENVTYNVSLVVVDDKGLSSVPSSVIITVFPESDTDPNGNKKPSAKFSASPQDGIKDLLVNFVDESVSVSNTQIINKWVWDFYGDGNLVEKTSNDTFAFTYTRVGTFTPKLYVVDSANIQSSTFIGSAINVREEETQNTPPVADFSYVQTTFTGSFSVQFTDLSSDKEGSIVSWEWSFGDTKSDSIQNPINIYGSKGIYNVTLTVYDNSGAQNSITKTIEIIETNLNPPTPDFSFKQRNRSLVVDFTDLSKGTGTLAYKWFLNDKDLNITDTTQNPSYTYPVAGTYNVRLEVTDINGTSPITKQVAVIEPINLPPSIDQMSGLQVNNNPLIAKFSNTSSDTDGFITEWVWNYGDGSSETFTDLALSNPEHEYANPGQYQVTLKVTDDGLSDGTRKLSAQKTITQIIIPPPINQAPRALFSVSNNNVFAPINIVFTDLSTDQDGKIVKWKWYLDNVLVDEYTDLNYKKTISLNFTKSGLYQVSLIVEDNSNTASLPFFVSINIINKSPNPVIIATPNPQNNSLISGSKIIFDGSFSSDQDGFITRYSWNFGLSGTYQNAIEEVTYSRPGTYIATLTVTDNLGLSATSAPFIFNIQNIAPTAIISHQYANLNVKAPTQLTFDASKSFDKDGTITNYYWEVVGTSQNSNSIITSLNFSVAGSYIVRLTVTDDFGAVGVDEVNVIVSPPDNILPIAILNSQNNKFNGFINDRFIFNPIGSYDPDGNIIYYDLAYSDGVSKRFYSTFQDLKIFTSPGTYIVKLNATDNSNAISLDTSLSTLTINILKRKADSSFTFDKINPYTLENIVFTNTSNDPDNSIVKWVWNFGDGTIVEAFTLQTANQIKQYSLGNRFYNVTLTTVDEYGNQYINTQSIYVLNRKPIAIISTIPAHVNNVVSGDAPLSVFFDSNAYDPDENGITDYEWEIVGLSQNTITDKSFTYIFTNPSDVSYEVKHRVKDGLGDFSDYVSVFIKVNQANRPPVVFVRASPRSNTALAPVTVSFSSSGTYDPDNPNELFSYQWDFGNGFTSTLANPQTIYSKPGNFNVSLRVTDSKGAFTDAKTFFDGSPLVYTVLNNRPVAVIDTVPSGISQIEINNTLQFTSDGSFDQDADQYIASYKWLLDNVELPEKTKNISIAFTSLGLHRVSLYVYDNIGLESLESFILINVVDVPPQVNLNPIAILSNEPLITGYIEINEGESIAFDGTNSYDPEDVAISKFEWLVDGLIVANQAVFTQTFNTAGIYSVLLNVYDSKNLSSTPDTNKGFRYSVDVKVNKVTSTTNNILSTGYNVDGQLALSDTNNRSEFTLINNTEKWVAISAGHNHSLFLNQSGVLYCSGSNSFGQLGLGSGVSKSLSLTKVNLPANFRVLHISAGFNKSAIVVLDTTNNKKLLQVCGDNRDLGLGENLSSTVYQFSTVLEFENTPDSLYYVECEKLVSVLHKGYILSTKTSQRFIEPYDQGVNYNGYKILRVSKNPDKFGAQVKLYVNKIEVFDNYICGIGVDNTGNSIWYFGTSNLRGYGYAKDISIGSSRIYVIILDQDLTIDKALFIYDTNLNFIKGYVTNFDNSPQSSIFSKVSAVDNHYLLLDEDSNMWVAGENSFGQIGLGSARLFSWSTQDFQRLPPLQRKQSDGNYGLEQYSNTYKVLDISAGTDHSIIINGTGIPTAGGGSGNKYDFPYPQNLFDYPTIIDITLGE
jgi:PKD repeat protein